MKKSDITERKFIESFDLDEWEIETPEGWVDISSIHKTVEYAIWTITFDNGTVMQCADTHIFIDVNNNEIWAKDALGAKIKSKNGPLTVISVEKINEKDNMYDVTVESDSHVYYTNDIESHNSITVAAFFLHYILFNDNKLVALLANKADSAREILGRIQLMYELLPKWIQHGVVDWNKGSFQLENGSRIIASATSSSAIRGKSCNLLYLDEYAFLETNMAEDFMRSVYPTISSGTETKIIITSTPFGMNHFYKIWTDAIEGRNGFKHLQVKWDKVPGRDEKWKEETLKNIGQEAFSQEYDIEFIGSAGTLIDPTVLKTLVYREPVHETRELKIYFEPVKYHNYIMTVDCSEGLGLDYSAAVVIDISTIPYQQVAVYRSNEIDPHQFPDIIKELSEKYNDAYTLCELNSTGTIVTSILWNELEFEHLLWCSNAGRNGQVLGAISGRSQMGLKTSPLSKRIGCSVLKTLIESYQLIVNDYTTIQELFAFARDGNTYNAQEGNNDDTVACLFLFGWMTKQTEFQTILENAYRDPDDHNIRNRLQMEALNAVNDMLLPMPIIDDGLEEDYLERSKRFHAPDPFSFINL